MISMSKKIIPLNLCYKGERDYIHSTDIYQELVSNLVESGESIKLFSLSIHKIIRNQCDIIVTESRENIDTKNKVAQFLIQKNVKILGYLSESNKVVNCRYEYNEELMENSIKIVENTIIQTEDISFKPIELISYMTKILHNKLLPPYGKKWMFTKVETAELFNDANKNRYKIKLNNNFNNKLTKSEIIYSNKIVGHIYFSLVQL